MGGRDTRGVGFGTDLGVTLRPELRVTPALIQTMEVVALPLMELEVRVWQLLEENPFLELDEERWREEREGEGEETPWWERLEDRGETLHEHLEAQLALAEFPARVVEAARALLPYMDSRGFLALDLEELASHLPFSLEELEKGRWVLASLDPLGCGARDVKESLLFQARIRFPQDKRLEGLLERGWELLLRGMRGRLATRLRLSSQELDEVIQRLRELTPYPGGGFSTGNDGVPGLRPDILVEYVGEEPVVCLAGDRVPPLKVRKMTLRGAGDESLQYFRTERAKALGLMRGVMLRKRYLRRLGLLLAEIHKEFLLGKRDAPMPLSVSDMVGALGISEATVNRLITGKYLHTPRGTFPLRALFQGERGGIKELIKNLVAGEDRAHPLGDGEIARKLKERGYKVARRTVAKYREEMNIPSRRKRWSV